MGSTNPAEERKVMVASIQSVCHCLKQEDDRISKTICCKKKKAAGTKDPNLLTFQHTQKKKKEEMTITKIEAAETA